jgi:phosphomethylpyrimidine synthase
MSLLSECRKGLVPREVALVAKAESIAPESLRSAVADGGAVVLASRRGVHPVGIGKGLRKKFAVIVGASTADTQVCSVTCRAAVAEEFGAAAVHDGSVAGDIEAVHSALLGDLSIPLAFCQSTRVAALCQHQGRSFLDVEDEEFISLAEKDAASGCEILVGAFAVTTELLARLAHSRRIMQSPNRTGSLMIAWMRHNGRENPYVEHFDRLLKAARDNDVVLSFVGAFRSGCIADAMDELQIAEIRQMGAMVRRAHEAGVQVKVGSGGHVPLNKIGTLIAFEKEQAPAPIISFGPLVTDVAVAYDHVIAAVGQAQALVHGADMVLTITAAEHLGLPSVQEVKEGCIIARHVCHSVDVAGGRDAHLDRELSEAREQLDWQTQLGFALDRTLAESIRSRSPSAPGCSICGDACAYLLMRRSNGDPAANE